MEDRILHEIAALSLEKLGANAARILDRGVDVKFPEGHFRIEVRRL